MLFSCANLRRLPNQQVSTIQMSWSSAIAKGPKMTQYIKYKQMMYIYCIYTIFIFFVLPLALLLFSTISVFQSSSTFSLFNIFIFISLFCGAKPQHRGMIAIVPVLHRCIGKLYKYYDIFTLIPPPLHCMCTLG